MPRFCRRSAIVGGLAVVLGTGTASAVEPITASFEYQMGDNDSRNDARTICYLNAKRKALEQAGVYIESVTEVRNLQLQRQDVIAFTAAIAKIEQSGDRLVSRGNAQVVTCMVRVTIDQSEMETRLRQFGADKSLQVDLRRQRDRIGELEARLEALTKSLGRESGERAAAIRLERSEVISDIRSVEMATRAWEERTEKNRRLQAFIREHVKVGMTQQEVYAILGPPRDKKNELVDRERWYYGDAKDDASIGFDARHFVWQVYTPMMDKKY